MTSVNTPAGTGLKIALPRQFSRILGKLQQVPLADSLPLVNAAYDRATTPKERHLAMRLRLRLLNDHHALRRAGPPKVAEAQDTVDAPIIAVVAAQEILDPEPVQPATPPKVRKPKMMRMDLEGDMLSSMMHALNDDPDDMR